ncbi:MAG: methyltransferase [Cyclobacteriaceae bacterium]|nr:methyltransferase [Cyclobacteriaceae bacterium]
MKNKAIFIIISGCFFTSAFFLGGCASTSKNPVSKVYHNTAALYNAYFIANEHMNLVEKAIEDAYDRDFDKILYVFPEIDSSTIQSNAEKLEDCIVKASIAIQRHENSKWVEDSYVLIGKARFYRAEFPQAIETFKYVNTKGEKDETRHEALIALMRTFIHYNEYNNAFAVYDYLKKEKLNKDNQRQLYLTLSYLFQLRKDYENMSLTLAEAVPLAKKRHNAARLNFIMAQVYQHLQRDTLAYSFYRQCLKKNPDYEMSFYAKLYMAQVSHTSDKNLKKIRKYFAKLLKDQKNTEYRDKIYYEMAGFELKQENHDEAVDYLRKSVAVSTSNLRQKAYSYLKLGELHYDHYKNYELAKNYYDSTVSVLPKDDERFDKILERQKILQEFVEHITTIKLQDSLISLARMDNMALLSLLDAELLKRKTALEDEQKARQRAERRSATGGSGSFMAQSSPFSSGDSGAGGSGGVWYFYNNSAISTGRSEFVRRWGNRSLEDNWRRSRKESSADFADGIPAQNEKGSRKGKDENIDDDVILFDIEAERENLLATIPFSEEAQKEALEKIEHAYYHLGNIYSFKLYEKGNAKHSFETLLVRFPETEYHPEALYQLYLICQYLKDENCAEQFKQRLLNLFPETLYAKLLQNPNYLAEITEAEERLQRLYKIAFDFYETGRLNEASLLVDRAMAEYPNSDFVDNLELLKILITGKVEGIYKYQYMLQEFVKNHENSELIDYANSLLETSRKFQEEQKKIEGIKFVKEFDHEHFFIIAFDNKGNLADVVSEKMAAYTDRVFPGKALKTGSLNLTEDRSFILVNVFANRKDALEFLNKVQKDDALFTATEKSKFDTFVISRENFQVLFQSKAIGAYLEFYKENYL